MEKYSIIRLTLTFLLISCYACHSEQAPYTSDGDSEQDIIEFEEVVDSESDLDTNLDSDSDPDLISETDESPAMRAKQISAGFWGSCAVMITGDIICWGSCQSKILGDSSHLDDASCLKNPVTFPNLGNNNETVSVRNQTACSVKTDGSLKCWGEYPGAPLDFADSVSLVTLGGLHSCVLTQAGAVKCWGSNRSGALGSVTTETCSSGDPNAVPWPCSKNAITVTSLTTTIAQVTAGVLFSCAITKSGNAKCWGANEHGQLGDGTTVEREVPVDVSGLNDAIYISAGEIHTCAVNRAGAVKCWGDNAYGQLGDGTTESHNVPVEVSGLSSGVIAVSASGRHTCALLNTGGVKCWGLYGLLGQLGEHSVETCDTPDSGVQECSKTPMAVFGISNGVISLSAGASHTCVVLSAGNAKCWGANGYKQLGDGTKINRQTPVEVVW